MSSSNIETAKAFVEEKIMPLLGVNEDLKRTPKEHTFFTRMDHISETANKMSIKKQIEEDLKQQSDVSIYIHFPVCKYTCGFCHYPQSIGSRLIDKAVDQLTNEISIFLRMYPELKKKNITSFYVGGGTPSLMNKLQLEQIVNAFKDFKFSDRCEKTIEGTPDSLTEDKVKNIIDFGFNRISIGLQTLDDNKLLHYKRGHTRIQSLEASLRLVEEPRIKTNADFIYGFPNQSVEEFLEDIKTVAEIGKGPSSITLYRLRLERFGDKETTILKDYEEDPNKFPNQKDIYVMKLAAALLLKDKGYIEGPIGWFHKVDQPIQVYRDRWLKQIPLLGFGWKAYSYSRNMQFTNEGDLEKYQECIKSEQTPIHDYEIFDDEYRLKKELAVLIKYGGDFQWNIKGDKTAEIIDRLSEIGLIQTRDKNATEIISVTEAGKVLVEEIIASCIFEKSHSIHSNILTELS